MGYIGVPTTTDPDAIAKAAILYIQSQIPGWVPRDGQLSTVQITALAQMLAMSRDVASIVPDQIFEYYGSTVVGVAPIAAVPATVTATITAQDNAGYTIPAGSVFGFQITGSSMVPFQTTADVVIPPGSTQALGVVLTAVIPGVAANAIPAGPMVAITPLAFLSSVVATTASGGGADAETSTTYLGRLAQTIQLMAPRPILPNDFAVLARSVAGVYRALGIDGYNPADGTHGNARMVAVSAVDSGGNVISSAVQTALINYLDSERELNFIVNWVAPTYTVVDVNYTVHLTQGANWSTVELAINNAITSYLSQAHWGGGDQTPPAWDPSATTVRYLQLAGVIEAIPGVAYVATVTLNGSAANVVLPGVAPMANVGVITGAPA